MFQSKRILFCALALLLVSQLWLGCGSDNPASPGPGGGGNPNLSLPPGAYDVSIKMWTCGMTDTTTLTQNALFCVAEVVDELPGDIACPIKTVGDSLYVDCTETAEAGTGCIVTTTVTATGAKVGNTWSVSGTIMVTDTPTDCSGQATCMNFSLSATQTSANVPSGCAFSDIGTAAVTVAGGPLAGPVVMDANGSAVQNGSTIDWLISAGAFTGTSLSSGAVDMISANQGYNMQLQLAEIDPNDLPAEIALTVLIGGPDTVAPPNGAMTYSETRITPPYGYFATGIAVSGEATVMVQEVSIDHVAGTMTLNLTGTESGGQFSSERTITGGFFVVRDEFTASNASADLRARLMNQLIASLRAIR